jgi:CheY-like chemotaxis protein
VSGRVVVAVPDLFFASRILAAAKDTGAEAVETTPASAVAACAGAPPALVIVDLHADGALDMVRSLKADPALARVPVVGFYSHVETGLFRDAVAAGIDRALARSAFTKLLPDILRGGVGPR